MVLAQVALGAAFRHRVLGLMPHVIGAMIVALAVMFLAIFVVNQFPTHRSLRPAGLAVLGITFVQIFLGIAAYFARLEAATQPLAMVLSTVAHVAAGGLTLASTIVLSILIRRNVRTHAAVEREHAAVAS
jgi:heme A synthase